MNFGPQTKKLLRLMYIDHNVLFSGDYISALRGCCPLKFFLQIDPGLLVHTTKGKGGPQKILIVKIQKFCLKFSVLGSITSGLLGVSSRNLYQSTCRKAGVINLVQFLEGPLPKIWQAKKNRPKFDAISDNFRLCSRISPERIHKSKIGKVVSQLQPLPR